MAYADAGVTGRTRSGSGSWVVSSELPTIIAVWSLVFCYGYTDLSDWFNYCDQVISSSWIQLKHTLDFGELTNVSLFNLKKYRQRKQLDLKFHRWKVGGAFVYLITPEKWARIFTWFCSSINMASLLIVLLTSATTYHFGRLYCYKMVLNGVSHVSHVDNGPLRRRVLYSSL